MTSKDYADSLRLIVNRPDFKPYDGKTFCNFFVQCVAHLFNYHGFDGKMANAMIDLMENGMPFTKIQEPVYTSLANIVKNTPTLIIAGQRAKGHGHLCVLSPSGGTTYSSKWKKTVCNVANVGKTVFENKGLNWAFATEPTIYIYQGA